MNTSIVIADDHPLVLKGLQDFLTEKGYNIIDSATNGKEAYKLIIKHQPDIAILDIQMPQLSGIEIAKLCYNSLSTKIILITFEQNDLYYHQAKQFNVHGYLLKEQALVEIEKCLEKVSKGKPYFSKDIEQQFATQKHQTDTSALTTTEKRLLKLIAENKTAKEIASILCVSNRTVEKHKSNIIKKLDLGSRQNNLLIWAKENSDKLL